MQPWAAGRTFSRFKEYLVESTLTGTLLVHLQVQELWEEECQAQQQVSHVVVEEAPLFTSTHKQLL